MPIIDIQRRMAEVGRIRAGHQVPHGEGTRPAKLETWRLTSRDEQRIRAAAEIYGGDPKPWEGHAGEWEVFTTADALPIMLLPGQALSQWYELWGQKPRKKAIECLRRCDGRREVISDSPCLCPEDDEEQRDLAKQGKACKPHTRLSVMLPDLPGIGHWRLESHGWYAAVELAGSTALLERVTASAGHPVPARLRLEPRRSVRDGQTMKYAVPVIDIDVTMPELMAGRSLALGAAPAAVVEHEGHLAIPQRTGTSVDEALEATARQAAPAARSARSAAPIGAPIDVESGGPITVPADEPLPAEPAGSAASTASAAPGGEVAVPTPASEPVASSAEERTASDPQRRLLFATARDVGLDEAGLKEILVEVTGQDSTKAIPTRLFDAVLSCVKAKGEAA